MHELSSLTRHFEVPTNRLYDVKERLTRRGDKIIDLVSGNVNAAGIHFPPDILKRTLEKALRKTQEYRPDPLGQMEAREAISGYYAGEGLRIPAEHIVITPGTSLSYWYAFKILADFDDEILAPVPSYPLFDSIAQLSGVKLVPYRLLERDRWEIDFDQMESRITSRTKAIILISPHNPTGAVATQEEVKQLCEIANRKNLAIISDEVFSSFLFSSSPAGSGRGSIMDSPPVTAGNDGRVTLPRPARTKAPLVITLNGFSKMLALPGLKIGWMALSGELSLVQRAVKALDMISDTFLPVNEAVQACVRPLFRESSSFQTFYRSEIEKRMKVATDFFEEKSIPFIKPEGGFFISLPLRKKGLEEASLVCRLLEKDHILVHPGYYYDLEDYIVFSFVSRPTVLRKALKVVTEEIR